MKAIFVSPSCLKKKQICHLPFRFEQEVQRKAAFYFGQVLLHLVMFSRKLGAFICAIDAFS